MKAIILMICLLFSVSCKTNDFISTALCLIRNETVKEEALNIFNKILNKDYENILQNLATAYIKVKDVLLNECLKKDDDNHAALRSLSWCLDETAFNACIQGCFDMINEKYKNSTEYRGSTPPELPECANACYKNVCLKIE